MVSTQRFRPLTVVVLLIGCLVPARTWAQISPPPALDDASRPRLRLRGLSLNPTFALTNAGVDSNVFNSVDDPKRDFTMTLSPGFDSWIRAGRTQLAVRGQTDLVYFQQYSSERSVDGGFAGRLQVPLNRLAPWVDGTRFSGRQRAGYEIDARSRRRLRGFGFGLDYRLAPKTTVSLGVHRDDVAWDGDATFLGSILRDSLDHRSDSARVSYQQRLTTLTTLVVDGAATRDRFDHATFRNADSTSVLAGFDLKPRALINGSARVGMRNFYSVGGGFTSFTGLVARADLGYVLRGALRLSVQSERDANYSFELDYPYYVQTGFLTTLTQRLATRWDVQLRVGRQNLAYRAMPESPTAIPDRVDRVGQWGGGIGYRMNSQMRLGFNLDQNQRTSVVQQRQYDAVKFGASLTYEH